MNELYSLRDHGEASHYIHRSFSHRMGIIQCWGYNTILDNTQAAVLNVKLKYLPEWIERRKYIATMYDTDFYEIEGLIVPPDQMDPRYSDVFQNYVIRLPDLTHNEMRRDAFQAYLAQKGIETQVKWRIPNHKQKALGLDHFNLPVTERLSREVLSLPIYPELTDEEVQYVIDCIKEFYGKS